MNVLNQLKLASGQKLSMAIQIIDTIGAKHFQSDENISAVQMRLQSKLNEFLFQSIPAHLKCKNKCTACTEDNAEKRFDSCSNVVHFNNGMVSFVVLY